MTTTTYTTTETPCDCFEDFALAIIVTFNEEDFPNQKLENLCTKCLDGIVSDKFLTNIVIEPKLSLF